MAWKYRTQLLVAATAALTLCSCGSNDAGPSQTYGAGASQPTEAAPPLAEEPKADSGDSSTFFPDVVAAQATQADDGTWTFSVTLSSPYDRPEQYADAWRVVDEDGTEYGIRVLTHDHANEQPFTRSQSGIEIPDGVTSVIIEGRDQVNGWGGEALIYGLPS